MSNGTKRAKVEAKPQTQVTNQEPKTIEGSEKIEETGQPVTETKKNPLQEVLDRLREKKAQIPKVDFQSIEIEPTTRSDGTVNGANLKLLPKTGDGAQPVFLSVQFATKDGGNYAMVPRQPNFLPRGTTGYFAGVQVGGNIVMVDLPVGELIDEINETLACLDDQDIEILAEAGRVIRRRAVDGMEEEFFLFDLGEEKWPLHLFASTSQDGGLVFDPKGNQRFGCWSMSPSPHNVNNGQMNLRYRGRLTAAGSRWIAPIWGSISEQIKKLSGFKELSKPRRSNLGRQAELQAAGFQPRMWRDPESTEVDNEIESAISEAGLDGLNI